MRRKHLGPQPGPQTDFLACGADVVLYGGAAGGGKSYGLLLDVARYITTPGWGGIIFRRNKKDLRGGKGSLFAKARALFADTGAIFREGAQLDIRWPYRGDPSRGATLEFRHLEDANVQDYQGLEYAWIGIDEATHLELAWIRYLITRARTECGTRAVVRMSCNPDPDHELREWVAPYLLEDGTADRAQSGRVRYWQVSRKSNRIVWGETRAEAATKAGRPASEVKSFAFVASKLEDNPALLRANPAYAANLAIDGAVTEAQLRDGNWNIRAEGAGLLRGLLERIVDKPLARLCSSSRGWDKAGTEPRPGYKAPDFTAGVRLDWDVDGNWYWSGLAVCRREPPGVLALMRSTATLDGQRTTQAVYQDPGQAGKTDAMYTREQLLKSSRCGRVHIEPAGNRANQKVVHATPVAEDLRQGRGFILAGAWLDERYEDASCPPTTLLGLMRAQLGAFPSDEERDKDDLIDALSLAHKVGKGARVVTGDPRKTAAEARALLRRKMESRYGGRHGQRG